MKKDKIIIKREKWKRFGFVNVARRNGKLLSWEKWNRKQKKYLKTFVKRKSKTKPQINPNVLRVINYKRINKIITKKPISGEVGQIAINLKAKKGRQVVNVDGYSFLNVPTRSKRTLNKMISQAQKSAYAKLPFSPDSMRITNIKYIYYTNK